MSISEISDKREIKEFRKISFSNFKKTEVKKELLNNLKNSKLEQSCYWCAELLCAGHFLDVWDLIIHYMSKFIYLGNPKLPLYINIKLDLFKKILNKGYIDNILKLRNNKEIRELFAEVICVLCLSKKKNQLETIKIKEDDFNITKISHKLKADGIHYCKAIFVKEDPKELFIAVNEFIWNIRRKSSNCIEACYWLEWILGFEKAYKKTSKKLIAGRRNMPVENTLQKDIIWIIWECILLESSNRNEGINKITRSLLDLFCLKYTTSTKSKRKHIIYFCINLLTEPINSNIKIVNNVKAVENVTGKIDMIYKQIKKNEVKPATDYLFNNSITKNNNLEKTIQKLDKLNTITGFIPRNN